jgi:methylated-DNA-[protein]-cysteine S-methyltransferase
MTEQLATAVMESALGPLSVAATDRGVVKIVFSTGPRSDFHAWLDTHAAGAARVRALPILDEAVKQLRDYFAGTLSVFTLPLDLRGTEFQLRVWQKLREIPYGETITYGELAERLTQPGAQRAVGLANGANPVPIVVPCHRVIAAGGRLGGFGGGLDAKRRLLALECRELPLLRSV